MLLLAGLLIVAFLGVLTLSLCAVASQADRG